MREGPEISDVLPEETPSVARSTASMSLATLLSRVTGFVRTWAIAFTLGLAVAAKGAIPIGSSFNIANNIPNMIYELLAGGILSAMFIPMFLEKRRREGQDAAFALANTLFSVALVLLGAVALFGTFFPHPFVWTQTFTVSTTDSALAVYLFRFFAVQIIFYGFSAIATGVLNSYRHFLAPAIAPVFNNIVVIVVLLGVYLPLRDTRPDLAVIALGVGTTLGVLALLVFTLPPLFKLGFRPKWSWDLSDPYLRRMVRMAAWIIVYVFVNMVQISFRNAFATQVSPDDSVALAYAWMWYQLPYGVLAVAYFTALFPELSDLAVAERWQDFKTTVSRGLRVMGLLILPMAALLVGLAEPLVSLYRAGRFSGDAVAVVVPLVRLWALGLFSFAAFMVILRAFYAMKDTRTPALVNLAATAVQIGMYWYFTRPEVLGLNGIPLADAIFFTISVVAMFVILRKRLGPLAGREILWSVSRVTVAAAIGGAAAWSVTLLLAPLGSGIAASLGKAVAGGIVGLSVAYGLAALLRVDEVHEAATLLRRVARRIMPGSARS